MAYEATPSGFGRTLPSVLAAARRSDALWLVVVTRAAVLCVAALAALSLGPPGADGGLGERNAERYDVPALTHPLDGTGDGLLSPLARWDAVWYLRIADSGYEAGGPRAAFFPLYPLLVRGGGEVLGGTAGARLVAAYVVSLTALLLALLLLHRLVALELGRRLSRPTLLLLALFPGSLFLGAPYSESIFLLASVGAFYAARTDRWAWAGACAAAASATRSAGILLLIPLALLWLRSRRRPADALWLLLAPLGLAAYAAYLGAAHGDPLAFVDAQDYWRRHLAGPLGGLWEAVTAAIDGGDALLAGAPLDSSIGRFALLDLLLPGFLAFALAGCVGLFRRLPPAYGAYTAAALVLALSFPAEAQPLMSLPRFLAVLFPLFMWLALVCEERRLTVPVAAVSSLALGVATAQFATWHWIA